LLVLKFTLRCKNSRRALLLAKYRLADFLKAEGFSPGHWYANWKEIEENVWLQFKSEEVESSSSAVINVEILLRDSPPNVGGIDFTPKDMKEFEKIIEKQVKPFIIQLLDKSKIPYKLGGEE